MVKLQEDTSILITVTKDNKYINISIPSTHELFDHWRYPHVDDLFPLRVGNKSIECRWISCTPGFGLFDETTNVIVEPLHV